MKNEMFVEFSSVSSTESFARVVVGSFIAQLDPTMEELTEIKTVVSEAVTNSIIHGYNSEPNQLISISCVIYDDEIDLTIKDNGIGIKDIEERSEERRVGKEGRTEMVTQQQKEKNNGK